MNLETYWTLSRTHTYSLLFALPLLVVYEVLAAMMNRSLSDTSGLRNMADALLRTGLQWLGLRSPVVLIGALIAVAIAFIVHEQRTSPVPIDRRVFAAMLAESALLALLFGVVIGWLTAAVLAPFAAAGGGPITLSAASQPSLSLSQQLVLSLGAGLYEELLFRVLLVGGLAWILTRAGVAPGPAALTAVLVSAFVFSLVHFIGPFGDSFGLGSFLFRFIGGLAFSAIFVLRGFGIVAWTHALYDVFFLLFLLRR
jgi:membrane protease YdiL (CAAX protease family)